MGSKMKLFKIRGGIHPDDYKRLSADKAIELMPMPKLLRIPMQQHIGATAEPVVRKGDKVLKGQLLANSQSKISAAVHAPTSGQIMAIGNYMAPHPSGLPVRTITLKPDGEDRWIQLPDPVDPFTLTLDKITQRVAAAGVVGMGGATFPSAVKLGLGKRYQLHTLVINGAECEPYLTCDDRLMQEQADEILDGIKIMMRALQVKLALVAIENNKPEALAIMRKASAAFTGIKVINVPTRYPMGSEKHMVQALTGKETPARALTADIGIVVHNVATAHAVHEAVRFGRPLINRVVTVSGGAIKEPRNLRVPVGATVKDLLDYCGGFSEEPSRLLSGGPMMGQPIPDTKVPVVKGFNGVIALTARETAMKPVMPCIRCGSCVNACPCGLVPLEMAAHSRNGDLQGAVDRGLMDCIACGSCAYVCPAHIPLVQYFNYARGELTTRQRAQHKQAETKRLAEQRTVRIEQQKKAKREAMMRRREAAAKKKAAAQATGTEA